MRLFVAVTRLSSPRIVSLHAFPFSHERVWVLFSIHSTAVLTPSSTVRFLNLVRPFLPILPEVSSPDRKVSILLCHPPIHSTVCSRFLSTKKYYGRPLLSLFSWSAHKSPSTALCPPTHLTHSTGCVSSLPPIGALSWNLE